MISCVVLAGGKSERMGRDKKLIKINDKHFLEHVLRAANEFSDEVILSLASERQLKDIPSCKVVLDEVQFKGPIGGVLSGLRQCTYKYAAVVPCDSPLIKPEVFMVMAGKVKGYDAVVPKKGELLEPLHAVYRVKSMIEACEKSIEEGSLELTGAIARLKKVKYIPVEEFKGIDRELRTFYNVNYPEDLEAMRGWLDEC